MKYEHGGIEITMNEHDAKFTATVGGKFVRKESLAAMKKHIDAAAKVAFQEFDALTEKYVHDSVKIPGTELRRVKIKGVEKSTRYGSRRDACKVFIGFEHWDTVFKDCPETIKAYAALEKHEEETSQYMKARRKQQEELKAKLDKFRINPEDFAG